DPDRQTQITHLFSLDQLGLLRRGELDLGIFPAADEDTEIETEPLFEGEPLAVFLPAEHRLAVKPVLGPADLDEEILLTGQRAAPSARDAGRRRPRGRARASGLRAAAKLPSLTRVRYGPNPATAPRRSSDPPRPRAM